MGTVPVTVRLAAVRGAVPWLLALLLSALLLPLSGYATRDPDSRVYVTIAARLASEPMARWIAPEWWGAWGFTGPFREHPIGTFVLPALLSRAGYPPEQAPLLVNGAFQIACLVLATALATRFAPPGDARALGWMLQLLPIAFVFRVRANQEYPLLAGMLVALYAIDRARERGGFVVLALAGFLWALLVKGVFALLVPVLAALWLLSRRGEEPARKTAWAWVGIAAMIAVTPVVAVAYEAAYRAVADLSFLDYYLGGRMRLEAAVPSTLPLPVAKAYNVVWYTGRVLWFAAPWSFVLLLRARAARRAAPLASRGVQFAVGGAMAVILLLSLRDVRADRYLFPAYFLIGAAGGLTALRVSPRFATLANRIDRWHCYAAPALWVVLLLARLLSGHHLPAITFWRT